LGVSGSYLEALHPRRNQCSTSLEVTFVWFFISDEMTSFTMLSLEHCPTREGRGFATHRV